MQIFQSPMTESLAIIGEIGGDIQKYHHPVPGWEKKLELYPWQIQEVEGKVERSSLQIPRKHLYTSIIRHPEYRHTENLEVQEFLIIFR